MGSLISSASSTFEATTGFSMTSVVDWMGDIIQLWIGMGLSVLWELKVWIGALIFIAAVVYFAFRALRFYRH